MKKHIANIITSCRILCSIIMIFFPVFSVMFYIMYLLYGLSDLKYSAIVLCFVATFSAIQEGQFIRIGKEMV